MFPNAPRRRLAAPLALLLTAGCAAPAGGGPGLGERISEAIAKSRANANAGAPGASAFPPELEGVFNRHPITNSQKPETWPRVAITVVGATPGVYNTIGLGDHGSAKADDCVRYKVKLWQSAGDARSFDNLQLCYGELYQRMKGVPLYQVPTWGRRAFFVGEKTTGSVRTEGPTPPSDHFPNDPAVQMLWLDQYKNTLPFVGGMLHRLGYNWNQLDDKRVWFVSAPLKT